MDSNGTLYLVATPIGNLEDVTYRAVRILSEVDVVLCEDTRVTGKLLARYEINAKLQRYDAHAGEQVHISIIEGLLAGKSFALVSDAGTPGVSDPGVLLVRRAREAGAGRRDRPWSVGGHRRYFSGRHSRQPIHLPRLCAAEKGSGYLFQKSPDPCRPGRHV